MRIIDWCADVCSSDLGLVDWAVGVLLVEEAGGVVTDWWGRGPEFYEKSGAVIVANKATHDYLLEKLKDAPDRKSVVTGKSVKERVNLSGRRSIKKNTQAYKLKCIEHTRDHTIT